jgi:hypothetical protein
MIDSSKHNLQLRTHRVSIGELCKQERIADLQETGGVLMNRNRVGIPLRTRLEKIITESLHGRVVIVLDFGGVEDLSGSVAEEIGPKLFTTFQAHRALEKDKYLIYDNLENEVRRELDAWFTKYDLPTIGFTTGKMKEFKLLGKQLPDALKELLLECYQNGPISSDDLNGRFKAASKKLNEIVKSYPWLLWRYRVNSGNNPHTWAYLYHPILPIEANSGQH